MAGFLSNVEKDRARHILKKWKDENFGVARTRMCAECGSDNELMWLTLHVPLVILKRLNMVFKIKKCWHLRFLLT